MEISVNAQEGGFISSKALPEPNENFHAPDAVPFAKSLYEPPDNIFKNIIDNPPSLW